MRPRLLLAGALVALAGTPLSGQEIRYSGSLGYATGSYTLQERTSSFSILNGLALTGSRWSLSADLPLIVQNSTAVSYVGGIQIPTGPSRDGMPGGRPGDGSGSEETTQAFDAVVGDPVLRATLTPYEGFGTLRFLEVQAMAKAPVADPATGVGTGQWDAGGGMAVGFGFGQTYLFADASVWVPGDMPDLELNTYGTLAAGLGQPLGDRWTALASVTVSSAIIDGISPPATLGGSLGLRIAEGRSLNVGASVGLTDSAPDLSIYLGWSAGP